MRTFVSIAMAKWDTEFYVKVGDDVHVNLVKLDASLACHHSKPRV